jgi:hypothetical protein
MVQASPKSDSCNDASITCVLSKSGGSRSHLSTGDRPRLCRPALPSARAWDRQSLRQSLSLSPPPPMERAKAVGRETLRTGGKILSDIAENK